MTTACLSQVTCQLFQIARKVWAILLKLYNIKYNLDKGDELVPRRRQEHQRNGAQTLQPTNLLGRLQKAKQV